MGKLNLDRVFKKVFKNSIHYANSILCYDVVIPIQPGETLYFQGMNVTDRQWEGFGLCYHGHIYRIRYRLTPEEHQGDFGCFYANNGERYIPIFFKEVLYETEQSKRDGDRVAPIPNAESKQL